MYRYVFLCAYIERYNKSTPLLVPSPVTLRLPEKRSLPSLTFCNCCGEDWNEPETTKSRREQQRERRAAASRRSYAEAARDREIQIFLGERSPRASAPRPSPARSILPRARNTMKSAFFSCPPVVVFFFSVITYLSLSHRFAVLFVPEVAVCIPVSRARPEVALHNGKNAAEMDGRPMRFEQR